VTALLYREAEYVDERRWDEWLALFDPQAEYWIPGIQKMSTPATRRPKSR